MGERVLLPLLFEIQNLQRGQPAPVALIALSAARVRIALSELQQFEACSEST